MLSYAPYLALAFWGTMIFFGLRSALQKGSGPLAGPAGYLREKLGPLMWPAAGVLLAAVVLLARMDAAAIQEKRSPVGVCTTLAFVPLVAADFLIAAALAPRRRPPGGRS